jgi:hypothetical protein
LFAFTLGFFPRGKAKALKKVLPPEIILKEDIEIQIKVSHQNLLLINSLDENSNFRHLLFNQLNKKQTLRFLKLHTKNYFKIVYE